MKLYLVQHGEAHPQEIDPDRSLTGQGRDDVDRLAALLKRATIRVDRVIHSGKLRALQTAQALAGAIAPGVELESSGLINPNDNPKAFDWQSENWNRATLVLPQLPFMARPASHLLVSQHTACIPAVPPGRLACVEANGAAGSPIAWLIRTHWRVY